MLLLQAILSLFRRPPERLKDLPQPPHRTRGWELVVSFLAGGAVLAAAFWGLYVAVTKPTAETLEKQRERRSATMRDEPESQPFSVSLVSFEDTSVGEVPYRNDLMPYLPPMEPAAVRPPEHLAVAKPAAPVLVPKVDVAITPPESLLTSELPTPTLSVPEAVPAPAPAH